MDALLFDALLSVLWSPLLLLESLLVSLLLSLLPLLLLLDLSST